MSELNCAAYRDDLLWYAADQLSGAKRAAIEGHLAQCADCRAEVAQWRSVATSIHREAANAEAPPVTSQATWANIQASLPPQTHLNGSAPIRGVIHMEFESDAQSVTPISTRQPEQSPKPRRTRWLAAVATVLVVVLGIAVFGVLHGRNRVGSPNGVTNTPDTSVTLPPGARIALPANWEINRAAIVTADDIWAVGAIRGQSKAVLGGYALILHYTAGSWHVASSSDFAYSALESIAMVSATEGWAVGYTEMQPHTPVSAGKPEKQTSLTLIVHYQNGVWKKVAAPSFIGTLYDVQMSSTGEGIATGFDVNDAPIVLLHYKDGVWSSGIQSPESTASAFGPGGVTYATGGDARLWAIGDHGIYRLQNNVWQNVKDPATLLPNGVASDIAVSGANDVWARLTNGTTGTNAVVAHYDGASWKVLPIPAGTLPANSFVGGFVPHSDWLTVMYSGSNASALSYAVGGAPTLPRRPDSSIGGGPNLLLHRDGNLWHASTNPIDVFLAIKDLTATQSIAFSTSAENGRVVLNIYHYQNGAWS